MAKQEKITSITFRRTANVFINAGIIGLYRFIERYLIVFPNKFPTLIVSPLSENELSIECEKLLEFLEEVYYFMGKEVYDLSNKKQLEESDKYYFTKEPFSIKSFPKMSSYGLSGFITKAPYGPQPLPRKKSNSIKFKKLFEKDRPFAEKIANFYKSKGKQLKGFNLENEIIADENQKKGDSNIFLNEPYTKTPILEFNSELLTAGEEMCLFINEKFKKLISSKGSYPFLSNIGNFNSFLSTDDQLKISFKAKYLLFFSPAISYYSYQNKYETFNSYFFVSNNLTNLYELYKIPLFRQKEELQEINYRVNFKLYDFTVKPKAKDEYKIETVKDAVWESEIAFMLLYTFYKHQFEGQMIDEEIEEDDFDLFENSALKKIPISLITFRADKFSSTLRPNYFEEINNVKYILRLIHKIEFSNIKVQSIWQGLKLNSSRAQTMKSKHTTFGKGQAIERQIRSAVFSKIFKGMTILKDIEKLFFESYKLLASDKNPNYRNYSKLIDFLLVYEKTLNHNNMDAALQEKAVKLGKGIALSILKHEIGGKSNEKENAKNGRKDIIKLHNARTLTQFTQALIRIMKKYSMSNKAIEEINDENFIMVRQYAVIGALNVINAVLSSSSSKNN